MSLNHSQRTLRRNLLQARIADLSATEMRLVVECPRCRDRRELAAAAVVSEHGCGPMKVTGFLSRLRWSVPGCGSPPSRVEVMVRWGGRRVVLSGSGAE